MRLLYSSALMISTASWAADIPFMDVSPDKVCIGTQYYDRTGDLQDGTATCTGTGGASVCAASGDTNCKVTAPFVAADLNSVDQWDIRSGKSYLGLAGKIKFCRNAANTGLYDNTTAPAGVGLDIHDTIDDYNRNGAFPTQNPWGADLLCGATNWDDVTPGTCTDASKDCVYRDLLTKINWTERFAAATWQDALTACDTLTFAGSSNWRLPTRKESHQASIDGIRAVEGVAMGDVDVEHWTSTTANLTGKAHIVNLGIGYDSGEKIKTDLFPYRCVQ